MTFIELLGGIKKLQNLYTQVKEYLPRISGTALGILGATGVLGVILIWLITNSPNVPVSPDRLISYEDQDAWRIADLKKANGHIIDGYTYLEEKMYEKADQSFIDAHKICRTHGLQRCENKAMLGRNAVQQAIGNYAQQEEVQNDILNRMVLLNDHQGQIFILIALGDTERRAGNPDKALKRYAEALKIPSEHILDIRYPLVGSRVVKIYISESLVGTVSASELENK